MSDDEPSGAPLEPQAEQDAVPAQDVDAQELLDAANRAIAAVRRQAAVLFNSHRRPVRDAERRVDDEAP